MVKKPKMNIYLFISENVAVGGTCVSNKQCTGTANSGVCKNGTCVCETEYILFDQFCYEGETPFQLCMKVKKMTYTLSN